MSDHSPQVIGIAPDIANPVGYLVVHFDGSHGVWETFEHLNDAKDCAELQEEEHKFWCKQEKDWDIYPLYAGKPFKNSERQ